MSIQPYGTPRSAKTPDLKKIKEALSKWQNGLEKKGWNALFIENHDLPRVVSTLGNDKEYWRESATALATMYFMMQGTPFIYQGQEIGMTNVKFQKYRSLQLLSGLKTCILSRETKDIHMMS